MTRAGLENSQGRENISESVSEQVQNLCNFAGEKVKNSIGESLDVRRPIILEEAQER